MKHIVGFSGGIDSQACARWVLNRYPASDVIVMNSNAGGNEHPLTDAFVDWYSDHVHPVIRVTAVVSDIWRTPQFAETKGLDSAEPLSFVRMIELKKRPPSRKVQFCTEILKLRPQKRWIEENLKGEDYCRYTGVRRDESQSRKDALSEEWDSYFDCPLYRPIVDWTKEQCFDYVKEHGEQFNPLYKLGFGRVGCAPCINASREDIRNWVIRFPEMIDKIRGWEQQADMTFFSPMRPGVINNIDEVVAWAMAARGGRQNLLPIMHERAACESKYGLCE